MRTTNKELNRASVVMRDLEATGIALMPHEAAMLDLMDAVNLVAEMRLGKITPHDPRVDRWLSAPNMGGLAEVGGSSPATSPKETDS